MVRKYNLVHFWANHRYLLSVKSLMSVLSEIFFPCKMVVLGMILFLADFLFLVMMVSGMIQTSFELCALGLFVIVLGSTLNLAGWTSYIGNKRA